MKISLDVFGGDHGPEVIIRGALDFVKESESQVILTGPKAAIEKLIGKPNPKLLIEDAPDIIGMAEKAGSNLRNRKDSSMYKCVDLVAKKEAEACVSAGSSASMMALSLLLLKRLNEIERPALVTPMPNLIGKTYCLDMGANVDCKPIHLVHFALMGSAYAQAFAGIQSPKVGLISNGEEDTKGNELTRETHTILKTLSHINYKGYCEGGDIFNGSVDVVVCDGFVGNVILKTSEGLAESLMHLIKEGFSSSLSGKIGYLIARNSLKPLKKKVDYAQTGGAPLLGVNGISLICHGKSKEVAILNALRNAEKCIKEDLVGRLNQHLKYLPQMSPTQGVPV